MKVVEEGCILGNCMEYRELLYTIHLTIKESYIHGTYHGYMKKPIVPRVYSDFYPCIHGSYTAK
jgi:hypothetical protein